MRRRSPDRWTRPSTSMVAPSSRAIASGSSFRSWYLRVAARETTVRPGTFDSVGDERVGDAGGQGFGLRIARRTHQRQDRHHLGRRGRAPSRARASPANRRAAVTAPSDRQRDGNDGHRGPHDPPAPGRRPAHARLGRDVRMAELTPLEVGFELRGGGISIGGAAGHRAIDGRVEPGGHLGATGAAAGWAR